MRKFIDAERLKEDVDRRMTDNIEAGKQIDKNTTSGTSEAGNYFAGAAKEDYDILSIIDSLQKEVELPPVVTLSQFPTLRQSIEEQIYAQVMRKIPGCPPHAGITVSFTLRPSTVKNLKKDYEQNGIPATAVGKVFTNTDPMNLYVERDQWAALLGQFDNGQRVRIFLVKEDGNYDE